MSAEQQALLMVGDAGGPPPVPSCVGDPYYTCGPGTGLWTEVDAPLLSLWSYSTAVIAPNGNIVALGFDNTGSYPAYSYLSTDSGATWAQASQGVNAEYRSTAAGTDRIVCVAGNSLTSDRCAVSTDNGVTWTHYTSMPASRYWYGLAFGNGKFIAGAYGNSTLATSSDGVTWGTQTTSMAGVDCLAYGGGIWVAGYRLSTDVWRSTNDGVTWSSTSVSGAAPVRAKYAGGKFFLFNEGLSETGVRHSSDGATWSVTTFPFAVSVYNIAHTGTHYVCLAWTSGTNYYAFFSPDLVTWSWWSVAASSANFTTETVLTASGRLVSPGFRGGKAGWVDTAYVAGPRTVLSIHADTDPPVDQSCYQTKTVTLTGSASISDAQSRFGGKSVLVPNTGSSTLNGLVVTDHQDFDFGTGDSTIDLWAYRSANTYVGTLVYGTLGGGEFSVKVGTNGLIDLVYRSSGGSQAFSDVATWPTGQWVYFATQSRGTNWETYLSGTLIHSAAITGGASSTVNSGGDLYFGRTNASSAQSWGGYLDDIRVTRGAARYTADFTPPALTFCESTIDGHSIDGTEALRGVSTTSGVGTLNVLNAFAVLTSASAITTTGSLFPVTSSRYPDLKGNVSYNLGVTQETLIISVWLKLKTDGTIWYDIYEASSLVTPIATVQLGFWIDTTDPNWATPPWSQYTFSATKTSSGGSFAVSYLDGFPNHYSFYPTWPILVRTGLTFFESPLTYAYEITVLPKPSNPRYGESGYFTKITISHTLLEA